MASITIRKLDDRLKTRLKQRAAQHGRSMEEEARNILRESLQRDRAVSAADIFRQLFGREHGVELPAHPPIVPPSHQTLARNDNPGHERHFRRDAALAVAGGHGLA